jgi:hypothetical protein
MLYLLPNNAELHDVCDCLEQSAAAILRGGSMEKASSLALEAILARQQAGFRGQTSVVALEQFGVASSGLAYLVLAVSLARRHNWAEACDALDAGAGQVGDTVLPSNRPLLLLANFDGFAALYSWRLGNLERAQQLALRSVDRCEAVLANDLLTTDERAYVHIK